MSLFSIETVSVPLDAETYLGEKREYTQIIPETEYIALTDNNYVPLTQAQISLCAKIGYTYYCAGADPGGLQGPRSPLTTKNEAPAPKFYKIEAPEWQF